MNRLMNLCLVSVSLIGCGGFGPGLTDFTADFGNGCKLHQLSAQDIRISVGGSIAATDSIPAKVVTCGFDKNFVIAQQQQLDAKGKPIWGDFQYWIVDGPQKKRYGPYSEQEFAAKRKELGVPDSIQLRGKDSYRP